MSSTATRLLTLIQLLQRRPGQKAGELAAILDVSVRTLHRYLGKLEEMGLPLYSERGPYGGFSLVRGYRLPPLVFTPEEASALALGASVVADLWGPLYPQAAAGALAKLEAVLPDDQRAEVDWARRTLVTAGLRRPDLDPAGGWLEMLSRAAREHRTTWMRYQGSGQSEALERLVDPYALVHRWGWTYLVGYCHLRQAMRSFRLDRIEALEVRPESFEPPAGFDIQAYLVREASESPPLQARLRFEPQATQMARANRLGWEHLVEGPDGSIEVTFRAPDLAWAASTALALGPVVTVLEPDELRRMVADWAQAVVYKYNLMDEKTHSIAAKGG